MKLFPVPFRPKAESLHYHSDRWPGTVRSNGVLSLTERTAVNHSGLRQFKLTRKTTNTATNPISWAPQPLLSSAQSMRGDSAVQILGIRRFVDGIQNKTHRHHCRCCWWWLSLKDTAMIRAEKKMGEVAHGDIKIIFMSRGRRRWLDILNPVFIDTYLWRPHHPIHPRTRLCVELIKACQVHHRPTAVSGSYICVRSQGLHSVLDCVTDR